LRRLGGGGGYEGTIKDTFAKNIVCVLRVKLGLKPFVLKLHTHTLMHILRVQYSRDL